MSLSQMNFDNHLQRHQDLIRERANDRLADQATAKRPWKIRKAVKSVSNILLQWLHQQSVQPIEQPCPQPVLRESDI